MLWWPRQLTLRKVGSRDLVHAAASAGQARDFNWHNAIGFWCAPVIIVLTTTGMVISYTWASNLVYTLTGSPLPAASAGRGGGAAPSGEAAGRGRGGRGAAPTGRGAANDRTRDPQPGQGVPAAETTPARSIGLSAMMAQAERHLPTWRTTIIRLPAQPGGPVTLSISDRNYWNSFARSTLTIDASSGAEIKLAALFSEQSRAKSARLDAICTYRRARRLARRNGCRGRVGRRRLPRVDGNRARPAATRRLAQSSSPALDGSARRSRGRMRRAGQKAV